MALRKPDTGVSHWTLLVRASSPSFLIACALLLLAALLMVPAYGFSKEANRVIDLDLGASITLNSIGSAFAYTAIRIMVVSFIFFLISLPNMTQAKIKKRLERKSTMLPGLLSDAAMLLSALESEIRNRDEQLQLYDELEKLKDAEVERLVDRFYNSTILGIRTNWVVGGVFFVASVVVAVLLGILMDGN